MSDVNNSDLTSKTDPGVKLVWCGDVERGNE